MEGVVEEAGVEAAAEVELLVVGGLEADVEALLARQLAAISIMSGEMS